MPESVSQNPSRTRIAKFSRQTYGSRNIVLICKRCLRKNRFHMAFEDLDIHQIRGDCLFTRSVLIIDTCTLFKIPPTFAVLILNHRFLLWSKERFSLILKVTEASGAHPPVLFIFLFKRSNQRSNILLSVAFLT